jgi:hypothetical protein
MIAYMHPATARTLLALSRSRTAKLRAQRELRAALRRNGWDEKAARELAVIAQQLEAKQ